MFPRVVAVCCGWILLAGSLQAAPALEPEAMLIRHWSTRDGLPHNRVRGVIRTQDGFIWLATDAGVVRFDGMNFKVFSVREGLLTPIVLGIRETPDGTLWIATLGGGVSVFRKGGIENTYTTADGLPSNWVARLETDESGALVAITHAGAARFDRGKFIPIPKEGIPPLPFTSVTRDGGGTLWGIDRDRDVWAWKNGAWVRADPGRLAKIDALAVDSQGRLWAAGPGSLWLRDGDAWTPHPLPEGFTGPISSMAISPDGTVWVAIHRFGLCGFKDGRFIAPSPTTEFTPDLAEFVTTTSDGQLWVTTANGLYRLAISRIRTSLIDDPKSPSASNILGGIVENSPGEFIVATQGSGFYRWKSGHATRLSDDPRLGTGVYGNVTFKSADGTVWLGANNGLFSMNPDGSIQNLPLPEIPDDQVWVLAEYPEGMWVGTASGKLHLLANGVFNTVNYGGGREPIKALAREPDGTLWVGTRGNGLFRRKQGVWQRFDRNSGTLSNIIRTLYLDPQGRLWVGSDGGGLSLRLNDSSFKSVTSHEGLPSSCVSQIILDPAGRLWIGTNRGLVVLDKDALASIAAGRAEKLHPLVINEADGISNEELTIMEPQVTSDGSTAFATLRGFIRLRTDEFQPDAVRPPVFMEEIRANGTRINFTPRRISLPAGTDRLEFSFTGLNFHDPSRLKFRNRLNGTEEDWVDIGDRRVTEYRNLEPGTYQFQVEATTGNGLWSQHPALVDVTIEPHVWQTLWFRTAVVLAGVGMVALAVWVVERRRHQRKIEAMRSRQAVDAERARIARDLHDDVGASLTQMALQSQLVERNLTSQPQRATGYLQEIFKTASRMTRTLDEIIWAVNPSHDSLENFISFLGSHVQDVAESAGLRSRFDMPESIPPRMMPSTVRHHLYLAAKEALHNVVKHAQASEVDLRVSLDDGHCLIVISDDGKGFEESVPGLGEDGLLNMRQRLEQIRGTCTRHSVPGGGTSVEMRVPMDWRDG